MTEEYRRCPHCKGTGICRHCGGTGRLALERGKRCTSCYPHGSGRCQNCRGLGWFDRSGRPAALPLESKPEEAAAAPPAAEVQEAAPPPAVEAPRKKRAAGRAAKPGARPAAKGRGGRKPKSE